MRQPVCYAFSKSIKHRHRFKLSRVKDRTDNTLPLQQDGKEPSFDPLSQSNTLNDLLLDAIDEALSDLLGTRGRDMVYDHLARNYSLGREDLPTHMDWFLSFLESVFSSKGGQTIGRTIIRRLHVKLDWQFVPVPDFDFKDYMKAINAKIARELFRRAKVEHEKSLGKTNTQP